MLYNIPIFKNNVKILEIKFFGGNSDTDFGKRALPLSLKDRPERLQNN